MKTLGLLALLLGAPALAAPEPKTIAAAEPKAVATAQPKRPAAAEPKAVADASKAEVSVGETFTVEVRASGPAGTAFEFPPDIVDESFELHPAPGGSGSPPPGTHRYRAAVFTIGDPQVPPIPVRYRLPDGSQGVAKTAPIPLRVVSLLPKAKDEQKLADVRAPVGLAMARAFWIGLVVLVLLAAALVWWLLARRKHEPGVVATPVPALEPDVEALRALDQLVASGRLARGEYRPFYIELTAIVKRYLERRLGAPIAEMTTAEMLAHLRANPKAADMAATLRDLAGAADHIKFARGSGLGDEAERHLAAARALISEVESRMRPAAPEPVKAA